MTHKADVKGNSVVLLIRTSEEFLAIQITLSLHLRTNYMYMGYPPPKPP